MIEKAKENTAPNNWRRLHALILKAKEAKDFETLGSALDELCELTPEQALQLPVRGAEGFFQRACHAAIQTAVEHLAAWQKDPPPLGPDEAQIGPGHPDPPPPPPDKIVLTPEEVYVALNEGVGGVSLGAGDGPIYTAHAERLNALIAKKLSDANRHTIAHAKPWTAEEFDRLIEAPYHKHAKAFKDLQGWQKARAETCARIINERCGLIDAGEPAEEKLSKAFQHPACAYHASSEDPNERWTAEKVFKTCAQSACLFLGNWKDDDVTPAIRDACEAMARALNGEKAEPEAVEAPNVERSPSRAETPGESLYKILQRAVAPEPGSLAPIEGWPMVNAATRAYYERAAEWMFDVCRSKAEPVKPLQREAKYLREELTSFSDHTLVHVYELEFGRGDAAARKRDGIIEELLGLRK